MWLLVLITLLLIVTPSVAEQGFDTKYERDYNFFNPTNRYQPDNPLNPAQTYAPNNPFNLSNQHNPDNPLNPANRYNPDTPIQPLR